MFLKYTLYVGLVLTVVATVAPFVDRASGQLLAEHIRDGYPTYSADRVDSAVTTWLVVLGIVGLLGVAGWVATIRATRRGVTWSRWAVTGTFGAGLTVALALALTKDTSGEVGLAPALGAAQLLPCVAGLVAVALVWRRPTLPRTSDAGPR